LFKLDPSERTFDEISTCMVELEADEDEAVDLALL
jgi:hypothetical protein